MSILYGDRVRLRAIERADLPKFAEWVNDPEVTRGLSLYLPMSSADEERWFERTLSGDPNEKPLAIEIRDGEAWRLIGNCGLFGIEWTHRSAEIGIMIGERSVWDRGYGTEAMTLLLRVFAANARAVRSYEKAGFVEEGRLREAVFKNGVYDDIIVMSVLRSEWEIRRRES